MTSENEYSPPPCRIIMANGQWAPDVPPEIRESIPLVRDCEPEPQKHPFPFATMRNDPVAMEVAQRKGVAGNRLRHIEARPLPVYRPKAPKVRKPSGSRSITHPEITIEVIHSMEAGGMTIQKIAAHFGCTTSLIHNRLHVSRKQNPEIVAKETAMRTCQRCSKLKRNPLSPICFRCKYGLHDTKPRRKSPDGKTKAQRIAERRAKMVCACGEPKWSTREKCSGCLQPAYQRKWDQAKRKHKQAMNKIWRQKNAERYRASEALWRAQNPEKMRAKMDRRNKRMREARAIRKAEKLAANPGIKEQQAASKREKELARYHRKKLAAKEAGVA